MECGKCDVDDRAVDERDAGAENGRGQDPRAGFGTARSGFASGENDRVVAGRPHRGMDAVLKDSVQAKLRAARFFCGSKILLFVNGERDDLR